VWCPNPHPSLIACSHRSLHVCLPHVQTLYHHILRASKMRYKDCRRSCKIPVSARARPARPWHFLVSHLESSDGERKFMPVPLPGIDVRSRRLTIMGDRSESAYSSESNRCLIPRFAPRQVLGAGAGRVVRGRPKLDLILRCVCACICYGSISRRFRKFLGEIIIIIISNQRSLTDCGDNF
jgi:hypothetical protein